MNVLGYSVLLILWGCCRAQETCEKPKNAEREEAAAPLKDLYNDGEVIQYVCRPGYRKLGRIQYKCTNGKWERLSKVECTEKPCGHPGDAEFGTFQITLKEEFVFGARVRYECDDGYQMISRLNYRDCTATGWNNAVPVCEPRKCAPFPAPARGRIVVTGTQEVDEAVSVGHVLRFECEVPGERPVPKEVYCTQTGAWSNDMVQCQEITCPKPAIEHGEIRIRKEVFKMKEKLEFQCDSGYKFEGKTSECTEDGWNPQPSCKEIICYYPTIDNGDILPRQNIYKENEVIDVHCNAGFEAAYRDSKPTCTKSGWVPPPKCESKACNKPNIEHGTLYYENDYFPKRDGQVVHYSCSRGYLPPSKTHWGRTECTMDGWSPTPKCLRTCRGRTFYDVDIRYGRQTYLEGETESFKCNDDFTTPEGHDHGRIECLPSGQFSEAKCIRTCTLSTTAFKHYIPKRTIFNVGEKLQYECEDGYKSFQNNTVETVECMAGKWKSTPKCKDISCSFEAIDGYSRSFGNGDLVKFHCAEDYTLSGAERSQCYYFGWYPELPLCNDLTKPSTSHLYSKTPGFEKLQLTFGSEEECPQAPEVENAEKQSSNGDTVTYECKRNFKLYGLQTITCERGRWKSPPQCIEKERCPVPPTTMNRQTRLAGPQKTSYYSGDTVKYSCDEGYHIFESNEIACVGGRWPKPPTCTESPCYDVPSIDHGSIVDSKPPYAHGATLKPWCDRGYKLNSEGEMKCQKGIWLNIPSCSSTACNAPQPVQNAKMSGQPRKSYTSGDTINYICEQGYSFEKLSHVQCVNGQWTDPPACKKAGATCDPPPSVAHGDIINTPLPFYNSGTYVEFKCQDLHTLVGPTRVNCKNGAWSALPECLEPCTASLEEMAANKLQLRWDSQKKLYSVHDDTIEFQCISGGYVPVDMTPFRVKCNRGKLMYPKCIKTGSCIASSTQMDINKLILQSENIEIREGETVEFTCKSGYYKKSNQHMKVKCIQGSLVYPQCGTEAPPCPGPPSIEHGSLTSVPRQIYAEGSVAEYTCYENYALEGIQQLTCNGGEWSADAPQCIQPCRLTQAEIIRNNLVLDQSNAVDEPVKHKTSIDFQCKEGYVASESLQLSAHCDNGTITYPVCVVDSPCRVNEKKLLEHDVEMRRKVRSNMSFQEGSTIEFVCKSGFKKTPTSLLSVKCTKDGFEYPTCINPNPCRLSQEDMDDHQLELPETAESKPTYQNGETIEFKCKSGYYIIGSLNGTCNQNKIAYPTCVFGKPCKVSQDILAVCNIQLIPGNENKQYVLHGETIKFECKKGFKRHVTSALMDQECQSGAIGYPTCFQESK